MRNEATQFSFWKAFDEVASGAIESDDFLLLNRVLVQRLLVRNTLRVREYVVYERLKKWAENQLR